ncbi:MAG TPA: bifunctional diaminohydroxyphosphoribosylaminopyrimidine deaminase/5-amino-6-(5-phosphoribosylamino)uracil reductase RibD [Terriglobales bacterium]|nr:bifunctional diaminohydroxyphosphoribosylaminopyrimidine deaminase/5-amino-6-(5-phosphoribosylamino)uracil reductase RibD [Terriglobales bacterium]
MLRVKPDEARFMSLALRLAERGRGTTSPNPIVGAVVVRDGRVVGSGWHERAGADHAEVVALRRAGSRARGATLYCTLEPCAHQGRTPPCVEAILEAGIRRCVVAVRDPHRIVNGRGLRRLRAAGVRISVGLLESEARAALGGYWLTHTRGRPRVTWKLAVTLDGKVADRARRSRWITGPAARRLVHRLRAEADAVVIGSGTARADDPRLTARLPERGRAARQPLRVICDTRLRLPLGLRLFGPALAGGTVVACGRAAPETTARALERRGVRVWRLPVRAGRVSPRAVARRLAREGCFELLLECGPTLGTAWLRAGLVDRLALFTAPRVLGAEGLAWCGPLGNGSLGRALQGRFRACAEVGEDSFAMVELARRARPG